MSTPPAPISKCLREFSQGWAIGLFCGIVIEFLLAKYYNHVQRRRKEKEEFTPLHTDFELGECDDHVDVLEDGTREKLRQTTGKDGGMEFPKRVVVRK